MRRIATLSTIVLALSVHACSQDAGTNPFIGSDADNSVPEIDTGDNSTTNGTTNGGTNIQPNNGGDDMGSDECLGCLTETGECVDGDETLACGSGGGACIECGADEVCDESGSCVGTPSCGPDNCDGCCDSDGTCQSGDDVTACGTGGVACSECPTGGACEAGTCERPCNSETCGGCCDAAGECQTGDDDPACGRGGSQCLDCVAEGGTCSMGLCVIELCAASCDGCCDGEDCVDPATDSQCGSDGSACVDCGTSRTCDQGACTTAPDSTWDIFVASGDVAATKPGGGSWDGFNGKPDLFVALHTADPTGSDYIGTTSTIDDTLTATWDETVLMAVPARALFDGLEIRFWDNDSVFDDEICTIDVTIDANHTAFSGNLVESTCPDATLGKVRWKLIAN